MARNAKHRQNKTYKLCKIFNFICSLYVFHKLHMLFAGVFCILLVPFLLKPLLSFSSWLAASAYFMQTYGVIIDKGMLLNLLHTDTREAFSYFNASLAIWLIFATILPCVYVALIEISYGGFKSALRSRVKIALCTLVSAAIIFALMSKILYHFLPQP